MKRRPVETVCVHATSLLKPMLTTGKAAIEAPITSSLPGTVRWTGKAVGGRPREVRIAEQHAAPVGGGVSAEGPAVGADRHVAQLQFAVQRHGVDGLRRNLALGHRRAARRLRGDDARQHGAGAGRIAFSSPMRIMSPSVSGRTQAALRQAAGKLAGGVSRDSG